MPTEKNLFLLEIEGQEPTFALILRSDELGSTIRRYRFCRGKASCGFVSQFIRDPRFVGIDMWNYRHGFDLVEYCPSAWVQNGTASFQANGFLPSDVGPLESRYEMQLRCHVLKESRTDLRKLLTEIHSQYSVADAEKLEARYSSINNAFMAQGYVQSTQDAPYVQEIKRQELFNLHQAVAFAWKHAMRCTSAKRRPGFEAVEAVLEREQELIAGLEIAVKDLDSWNGVVELFDTPPAILNFFETYGTKQWQELPFAERSTFATAVGLTCPAEIAEDPQRSTTPDNTEKKSPISFRFKFTHEQEYRAQIRKVTRSRAAISMQRLGRDRFLLDWIVSPDIRAVLEATARTEPKNLRRADLQQSIVWITGEAMQQALVLNSGLDFKRNLIVEPIVTEWDEINGEILEIEAVVCVCDGVLLIASPEEITFASTEEFLVDRALFTVERSRHEIENRQRRPRRKLT